jgi:hypothetical protein
MWRDPASAPDRAVVAVPNTAAGIAQMLQQAPDRGVVVEPTGR